MLFSFLKTSRNASGIAAGMDMTQAVIARLYGKDVATWLELWTEYEPHPPHISY